MSGWLLLVPCHGGIGKRIHVTERKTSIERHKLSNYPKPYSKWKRYRPVSSQYLIIDQRIEMRFLNLFNALRPSTSSTLSSGCRPLVKFLKTLFSLKIISWRMKRFASRIGGPISLDFHQQLTTQLDLFQITELPQKRFQLIGFQALFLLKGLHHPTAWCHLPAFMRRSSLLDMDSADSCLSCCESVHFNKFSYNTLSIKASAWRSKTKERTVSRMKEPERLKEKTWT